MDDADLGTTVPPLDLDGLDDLRAALEALEERDLLAQLAPVLVPPLPPVAPAPVGALPPVPPPAERVVPLHGPPPSPGPTRMRRLPPVPPPAPGTAVRGLVGWALRP